MPDLRQARYDAASAVLLVALRPNRSRTLAQGDLQHSQRRAAGGHAGGGRSRGVSCVLRLLRAAGAPVRGRRRGGSFRDGGHLRFPAAPAGADDPASLGLALRPEQALAGTIAVAAMPGSRNPAALMRPAQRIRVGGQFYQRGKFWRRDMFGRGHRAPGSQEYGGKSPPG
jgi:hypothetical protein